jgi:hypothetical protein
MLREETYQEIHISEKLIIKTLHPSAIQNYMLPCLLSAGRRQ